MELNHVTDAASWGDLVAPAPLGQSWAYGAAAERLGARVHRFGVQDGGRPIGAVQCIERRLGPLRFLYSPNGVWQGDDAVLRAIIAGFSKPTICVAPASSGLRLGTTPEIAICDPSAPRPKPWRNAVARAERRGLCIMDHGGCPDWLWRGQVRQARARRYMGLPRRWLIAMERATPGTVRSLAAYQGGDPVAGITMLRHGRRWTYQIGWTSAEGRRLGAHNLLLDIAMRRAAEAGVPVFDLGMAPSSMPGLRRFKLSCGALIEPARMVRLVRRDRRAPSVQVPSTTLLPDR